MLWGLLKLGINHGTVKIVKPVKSVKKILQEVIPTHQKDYT